MKRFLLSMTIFLFATLSALAQPTLTSVFPGSVAPGSPPLWIEVNGTNLSAQGALLKLNGVVQGQCNGVSQDTGADGARRLRFCLGSGSFATAGEKDLVVNIGGVDSNPIKFLVGQVPPTSGAVLIFPWFKFDVALPGTADSELTIWYTDKPEFNLGSQNQVRVFFVGKSGAFDEINLTNFEPNKRFTQKLSSLAALPPSETEGYIVAIATNGADPLRLNVLSGSLTVTYSVGSGKAAGVIKPIVIKALSASPAACGTTTCDLKFDGINYERLPGVISFGSFNRIGSGGSVTQRVYVQKFPRSLTGGVASYSAPDKLIFTKYPTHFGVPSYLRKALVFSGSGNYTSSVPNLAIPATLTAWNTAFPDQSRGHVWAAEANATSATSSTDNTGNPSGLPIFGAVITDYSTYGYFEQASVNEQANPFTLTINRAYVHLYTLAAYY